MYMVSSSFVYIVLYSIFLVFVFISACFVFFFKQKTAYEMRISDWSSDVCSSDLLLLAYEQIHIFGFVRRFFAGLLGFDGNCGKETRRHQRLPQVIHFSAVIQLTAFEPGQNVDMLRCEDEIARRRKPAEAGTRS